MSTNKREASKLHQANAAKSFSRGDAFPCSATDSVTSLHATQPMHVARTGQDKGEVSTGREKSSNVRETQVYSGRNARIQLTQIWKCRPPEVRGQKPREQHRLGFLLQQNSGPGMIPCRQRERRHGVQPHSAPFFQIPELPGLNETMKRDRLNPVRPLTIQPLQL